MKRSVTLAALMMSVSFGAGMAYKALRADEAEQIPSSCMMVTPDELKIIEEEQSRTKSEPISTTQAPARLAQTLNGTPSTPSTPEPLADPPADRKDPSKVDLPTEGTAQTPWEQIKPESELAMMLSGELGKKFAGVLDDAMLPTMEGIGRKCVASWSKGKNLDVLDVELQINIETKDDAIYIDSATMKEASVADEALEKCIAESFTNVTMPAAGQRAGIRRRLYYELRWGLQ